MGKHLTVTKIFDASPEEVWQLWVDPELIKQWWGPDKFICDVAKIDFRIGGTSLVNMKAPPGFGGQVHFNVWEYTEIDAFERIEFIMNLANEKGEKQKPADAGMPNDFPENIRTVVILKPIDKNKTEMTVTEHADFGQIGHFAKLGLEQSLDKAARLL